MYTVEILGVDKIALLKAGTLTYKDGQTTETVAHLHLSLLQEVTSLKSGQDLKIMDTAVTIFGGIISTIKKRKN